MLKRLLCLIAAPVVVVALAARPASADVFPGAYRLPIAGTDIVCPLPWVDTAFGPGSFCVEKEPPHGGFGWYGAFSTDVPPWVNQHPLIDGGFCGLANVPGAYDGVVGFVHTIGLLDLGDYGNYRPGMQYAYYGFQAIGRPGLYRPTNNRFYPLEGWLPVSGNVPIPDHTICVT
jgi:hypothetical protein